MSAVSGPREAQPPRDPAATQRRGPRPSCDVTGAVTRPDATLPLRVCGTDLRRVRRQGTLLMIALLSASFGGALAARHGFVPWVDAGGLGPYAFLFAPLAGLALWWAVMLPRLAASGEAVLGEQGVTLRGDAGGLAHSIAWSAVAGYRDGASSAVQLILEGGGGLAATVSIPTPTEADRVAVLALLDARGLGRLG